MLQVTRDSSPQEITDYIAKLREQKGKEREVLEVIKRASDYGNDFVVNLFWELALTYQHLVMNEDAKGEGADRKVRSQNLMQMEETVKHAGYFIVRFDQERWKHRLYRFLGRVCDYKGEYKRAINYYKKSINYAEIDPDYLEYKYPRKLEVRGFLSFSMIMVGDITRGYKLARETFALFDTDKDAIFLKKNDYLTWAIWKSGIPIRAINALLSKNIIFDKNEARQWLSETMVILNKRESLKYRLDEVGTLLKKLGERN